MIFWPVRTMASILKEGYRSGREGVWVHRAGYADSGGTDLNISAVVEVSGGGTCRR